MLYIFACCMALLFAMPTHVVAQSDKSEQSRIAEQKRIIADLERQVAEEEKALSNIKRDKSTAQQRVRTITRQINARNQLLNRTKKQISAIEQNISSNQERLEQTQQQMQHEKQRYAEMVREAYRNHRQNNYVTYILASENFSDAARRIANIRAVAELRIARMQRIDSLSRAIVEQQNRLTEQREELDAEKQKAETQRQKLQKDVSSAKQTMSQLSKKEQATLREKMQTEERLDAAIAELRKLTKGNKEGASFSHTTSNLNLPLVGGTVRKYKGNMAEIIGEEGAMVRSIYEGKVVDVRQNRISGKYDVFVAHGEYITSYANLDVVSVEKGQKVAKNGTLGEVGVSVNLTTMEPEYKIIFGVYSPNPKETMRASDCFRKK